jgi:CMP-N-acetylneuraminic acid synthetase
MIIETKELDIVAIIPARGGSKRLPRKNVLPLAGKPLIQWTLEAAKQSGVVDLIAVTSDDDEILEVAGKNNGVKLINRPAQLATDTATSVDAVLHALGVLEEDGYNAKRVLLLQPTSPLRRAEDIRLAVKRMDDTGAASVISVCELEHSPLWANTLPEDGRMDGFLPDNTEGKRSQDFPIFFRINGAIYLFRRYEWAVKKSFFIEPCFSLVMRKKESIDIDDEFDFFVAESLSKMSNNQ